MRRKTPIISRQKTAAAPAGVTRLLSRLRFGPVLLFLSGMLLTVLVQFMYKAVWMDAPGAFTSQLQDSPALTQPAPERANEPPPWGDLEYMPFALDRPQEYFTNDYVFDEPTQWTFSGYDAAELHSLFGTLDLSPSAKSFLVNTQNWEHLPAGLRITVPPEIVVSLSSQSRRTLYRVLSQWPENKGQRSPFQFRADGFDQWFAECGLPREKIDLVRSMMYEDAGNLYFSDVRAFSQMSAQSETMCLVKSLWRVSTFILSVRISPDTELDPLIRYWGRGGRAHFYRPLLQSIQREGSTAVPVSYFFPAFARMRLFTYPNPRDARAAKEDCFWTAMNFFSEQPDDRFFNTGETLKALQTEFAPVTETQRQFGDALLLVTNQRKALHMCIYVADGVVFTKNGGNVAQPWVLMKLNEMLASYETDRPFEVRTYRKKNLPAEPALALVN